MFIILIYVNLLKSLIAVHAYSFWDCRIGFVDLFFLENKLWSDSMFVLLSSYKWL